MMHTRTQLLKTKWGSFLIAAFILGSLYAASLQTQINGSDSLYATDTGEIQIALNLAGTIHYSGYPLYTILSTAVAKAGVLFNLSPATAVSFTSLLWTLLSLPPLYLMLLHLTKEQRGLSASALLLLGVLETVWLHSTIAEVYSFTLLCFNWLLWLALLLHKRFVVRDWLIAMALLGTGIAHHRLLVLVAPGFAIATMPHLWQTIKAQPRLIITSALALLLPFLFYLYLPLRAWQSAQWVYGDPGTWHGFWAQFTGSEALAYVLGTPQNSAELLENIALITDALRIQTPALLILLATVGLIWLIYQQRWLGGGIALMLVFTLIYLVILPNSVFPPAVLMPVVVIVVLGWAVALSRLPIQWAGVGLTLVAAGWIGQSNYGTVQGVISAEKGVNTIAALSRLEQLPSTNMTVAIPWGNDHFSAAYGRYVTQTLPDFTLVDHNADFAAIIAEEGQILTFDYNLGLWHYDWWRERLGTVQFATAAPGVALVSQSPRFQNAPSTQNFDLGNGFYIRHAELYTDQNSVHVVIYWEKHTGNADSPAYSVAVHALSQNPPQSSADLVQQADASNPVGGWYPTTLWQVGEVVRDDYLLEIAPDTTPTVIRIGMYHQASTGEFVNSNWLVLPLHNE